MLGGCNLGISIPPDTPHAISVSLPTWRDNVGYEEGDARVVDSMTTGYPRFFIHLTIVKLASICAHKYAVGNEKCMLFSNKRAAEHCRSFIQRRSAILGKPATARLVDLFMCPDEEKDKPKPDTISASCAELHIVLFPADAFPIAKEFWQHTGQGISSRYAEKCLSLLPEEAKKDLQPVAQRVVNKRYGAKKSPTKGKTTISQEDDVNTTYLEERYGRNLPLAEAAFAKRALKRRIAGVLLCDVPDCQGQAGQEDLAVGPSTRGVKDVSDGDVYLYPTGMCAIWNSHQLALDALGPAKSVCFSFPYTDTLKVLEKWGPGCHFFGNGLDSDIDELEKLLEAEVSSNPGSRPVLALITEFPSNPLLRSADLPRLRQLADKYDFLIIIDETVGNLVNVKVLQYADIVVSSLTKVFSGESNVMGGSLILNPKGRHYTSLKAQLTQNFQDIYFDEDAIYMERNSRDFKQRVRTINRNAETVCDFLLSRTLKSNSPNAVIKEVFYPKYSTPEHYNHCRITSDSSEDGTAGGFGGLFSLTFTSLEASRAFFDNLPSYKGPSLGTNFTLACPFTILAHYTELDWAEQYGVDRGLIRISVGLEDTKTLLDAFETAVKAAEATASRVSA
ncbi:cystathionine gamma-synthase [Coprinopsis sp. MPI-PUGE-AT-0042]|nr:cystathionine gamma-synthase [Coprinopsis sp. MPI-PUGE-AT-0042]